LTIISTTVERPASVDQASAVGEFPDSTDLQATHDDRSDGDSPDSKEKPPSLNAEGPIECIQKKCEDKGGVWIGDNKPNYCMAPVDQGGEPKDPREMIPECQNGFGAVYRAKDPSGNYKLRRSQFDAGAQQVFCGCIADAKPEEPLSEKPKFPDSPPSVYGCSETICKAVDGIFVGDWYDRTSSCEVSVEDSETKIGQGWAQRAKDFNTANKECKYSDADSASCKKASANFIEMEIACMGVKAGEESKLFRAYVVEKEGEFSLKCGCSSSKAESPAQASPSK
jgi:hypothetical protein